MKTLEKLKKPFAYAALAAAASGTSACTTVRQDVCYPVSTLAYDAYGRPVAVQATDRSGRPIVHCHTVYHIVPKSAVEPR